jgi:hypothetical protein
MAAKSKEVEPFAMLCFGQQGAGKSFDLERLVRSHVNRMHIVYNPGHSKDWKEYEVARLKYQSKDEKLFLEMRGKLILFDKNFTKKVGRRARIKIVHEGNRKARTALLSKITFDRFLPPLCLIVDDATSVFRGRFNEVEAAVLSQTKHANVKLFIAFHNINYCPIEAFGLATHIRQFKTITPIRKEKADDSIIPMASVINNNWKRLQDEPQYSFFTIDVYKRKNILTKSKG